MVLRLMVKNTLRHLRVLDSRSYVVEDPYIDRDYSTDYAQFYARTFRLHQRHCKRIHFFSQDISQVLRRPLTTSQLSELGELGSPRSPRSHRTTGPRPTGDAFTATR